MIEQKVKWPVVKNGACEERAHKRLLDTNCAVQAKMMPATREGSLLSVTSGTAQRLVDDTQNGLAASAMTAPPADGKLANVALFIDQNSMQLVPEQQAAVERCACLAPRIS